jgi:hypothetical protein
MHMTRRAAVLTSATMLAGLRTLSRPRTLFVLGDSWAAGLHADPAHAFGQVASARLGWSATVDAVSGTGYVNGGDDGLSYPDRLRAHELDLDAAIAVVQGGSNDQAASAATIAEAAVQTLALLRRRLPAALPVMLGPGPDPMPVTSEQSAVDRVLLGVAQQEAVPYVSMLRQGWITQHRAALVLDPQNHHPTVNGQRYLGRRLSASLHHLYPGLTR